MYIFIWVGSMATSKLLDPFPPIPVSNENPVVKDTV